jgi:dGTP triphosphohydrolase
MDPTELVDLELSEVSLVDVPANKSATISLFKRDNDMNDEEIKKFQDEIDALKVEKTALEAQVTELTKSLDEATKPIEKAAETILIDGEAVLKSAIPASVLKKLETMQEAVEKADIAKRVSDTIPNFAGTDEVKTKLIKSIGSDIELINLLMAADKLFAKGFDEIGKTEDNTDMIDPETKLNKMAKDIATEKNITFEKGYAEAVRTPNGKALLKEIK